MRSRRKYLLFSFLCLGLAGAVGAYQALGPFEDRTFFILLIPFSLLCLVPVLLRLQAGQFDPFEPPIFTGLLYFFTFGLFSLPNLDPSAPLYAFLGGDLLWLNRALLYVTLGLIFLWSGYQSPVPLWVERVLNLNRKPLLQDSEQRIKLGWVVGFYGLSVAVRVYLLASGTYGFLKFHRWDIYETQLPFLYWLTLIWQFSSYAVALSAIAYFTQRGINERVLFYLILAGELYFIFLAGFRSHFLLLFVYIAVVYFYLHRRIPIRWILVGVTIVLLSFPLIEAYRKAIVIGMLGATAPSEVSQAGTIIIETVAEEGITGLLRAGSELGAARLSYIQEFASAIKFTDEYGYYPRRHQVLLFPVLAFIPRAIWPNKPRLDLGYWFSTEVLGGTTISANTTTLPGSFYLFFGFWGYLIAMFLMGGLQAFVYRRYAMGRSLSAVFFAPFLFVALVNPEYDIFSFIGLVQQVIIVAIIAKIVFTRRGPVGLQRFGEDHPRSKAVNFAR